jgi:hypothetical protein
MYRPLGGRTLLILAGASGAVDVANGTSGPLLFNVVLKVLELAVATQLLLMVGLVAVAITVRSHAAFQRRHDRGTRPGGTATTLER